MRTGTAYTIRGEVTPSVVGPIHPAAAAVLAEFRARGTTARSWALARGYEPRTVYACIRLWVPRTDRRPVGGIAREIREALRVELGDVLVPPVGEVTDRVKRTAA